VVDDEKDLYNRKYSKGKTYGPQKIVPFFLSLLLIFLTDTVGCL